jgi:hypothetical protein
MVALATPTPLASAADELVSSAGDTLSQVARLLQPLDRETAAEASAWTAALESRREGPFVLAVAGEDEAERAEALNRLLGEPVIDPDRTSPAGARGGFRRGATMEYVVRLRDGSEERFSSRFVDRSQEIGEAIATATMDIQAAFAETMRLEKVLESHAPWLSHAERAVGVWDEKVAAARDGLAEAESVRVRLLAERVAKKVMVQDTRLSWFGRAFAFAAPDRARRAERAERSLHDLEDMLAEADARVRAATQALADAQSDRVKRSEPITQARAQRQELEAGLAAARRTRMAASARKERFESDLAGHVAQRWQDFRQAVAELTDARARGDEVDELIVDIPCAPIPAEIVLLDLGTRGNMIDLRHAWDLCRKRVDGCLWIGGGEPPPELHSIFLHVTRVPRAPDAVKMARFPKILGRQRSLAAGRAALETVDAALASLDQIELRAQAAGRGRLERLEALRVLDVGELAARSLERIGGRLVERVELALHHAQDQLAWELDRLMADWSERLRKARDIDQLRTTIGHLREDATIALRAVEREVQSRLLSALAGGAHDLHADAVADLLDRVNATARLIVEPPTPGGSSHHRGRVRLADEVLIGVRRVLEPTGVQLGVVGMQPLARALLGNRAATLFDGLASGMSARLRGFASLKEECTQTIRERLLALRKAAEADLLAAEPDLQRLLAEALERLPARAALELDRALEMLGRAEAGGLEHDLAHLRGILASVRHELTRRQSSLVGRIGALGREIDAILGA